MRSRPAARIEVTMNCAYPPGGAIGEAVANGLSSPERSLREELQNFAKMVELGGPGAQTASR